MQAIYFAIFTLLTHCTVHEIFRLFYNLHERVAIILWKTQENPYGELQRFLLCICMSVQVNSMGKTGYLMSPRDSNLWPIDMIIATRPHLHSELLFCLCFHGFQHKNISSSKFNTSWHPCTLRLQTLSRPMASLNRDFYGTHSLHESANLLS